MADTLKSSVDTVKNELRQSLINLVNHTFESSVDTVKNELRQSLINLVNHTFESSVDTAKIELRQSLMNLVDEKINDILIEYDNYIYGYDNHYTELREECQSRINHLEYLLQNLNKKFT